MFNTNFIEEKKIKGKKYRSVVMGWRMKNDYEDDEKTNLDI